jgi:hypothetical protein
VREGLPPDGFWTEVSDQLQTKADKKILFKLLKDIEVKQHTIVESEPGTTPAAGKTQLHLRCLSCDKVTAAWSQSL